MSSYSDFANAQSDLLLKRGQAEAEGIANRGRGWGQTIATIGQVAGQLPQQIQAIRAQQQTQQKQAEIARIWQESDGDVDGALEQISAIDPVLGAEFAKPIYEARKSAYEFQTLQHKAKEQETAWAMNVIGSAKDQDSWARALMTLKFAGHDVAQYPPEFDPKFQEHANRMLMTASERLKADAPKEPKLLSTTPGMKVIDETGKVVFDNPYQMTPDQSSDNTRADAAETEAARHNRAMEARPTGARAAAVAQNDGLADTVIANPALWDQLTPTVRGRIAPELAKKGYTEFGKPMSEAAMKSIAESQSAIDSLKDLRGVLQKNEQYVGPIAGLQGLNPYSDARKAQANIDLVRQRVGKALEGGVLRKEDEEKYKKILATLRDTPETAIYKVDQLIKSIENNVDTYKATQRLGGKRLSTGGAADPLGIR